MKKIKMTSLALAGVMAASAVPAFAAQTQYENSTHSVEYHDQIEEDKEAVACDVYAEVGSQFKVTIPKKIVLSGQEKKGAYKVSVEGNIAGSEVINVTPDASFAMKQTGKADVTATVTQEVTKFRDSLYTGTTVDGEVLMGTDADGLIEAAALTAGAWNGQFNFKIELTEDAGAPVTPDYSAPETPEAGE